MATGFNGVPDELVGSDTDSDKERASPDSPARLKTYAERKKNPEESVQRQAAGALQESGRTFHQAVRAAQIGAAGEDDCRRTLECASTKLLCVL